MSTHITVRVGRPKREHKHSHDDEKQIPGWAKERTPLDEKRAPTLNSPGAVANWTAKASARSGPAYAPGTGTKKSSS